MAPHPAQAHQPSADRRPSTFAPAGLHDAEPKEDWPDACLLAGIADGDREAMAVVWSQHYPAALRYARRLPHRLDAEDMVSEAFTRLVEIVQSGRGGPQGSITAYLFVIIRNIAMKSWHDRSLVFSALADADTPFDCVDPATLDADLSGRMVRQANEELLAGAFENLPARWREALWCTVVDEVPAALVAERTGIGANAVAALCYRARRALRAEWMQEHVPTCDAEGACAWTRGHAGAYLAGTLCASARRRVDQHLDSCRDCRRALADARADASLTRVAAAPY
ncbi:sigma-70 family RNA polymerase sigma factor [Xylanimonas allomyrinae]|uniref:Sigma-70 family RNA polymerase sigma factor n=1 Tax=Xylanimonas allomyrinae TaxID=2509459 RepID=A0A4P6ENQ5_9MICO|nr:sigma-70 family RNA polymerase sigma factor [Xylanimonas allomyrinae]QAY62969.1 sigma-70 family RNA polymerase sigma factor [Xylanimonas allomyrinae]